jgi:hypothetical protein
LVPCIEKKYSLKILLSQYLPLGRPAAPLV